MAVNIGILSSRSFLRVLKGKASCRFSSSLFDSDSNLQQVQSDANTIAFDCHISKSWSVGNAPNGGYLASICLNAAMKVNFFM